MRTHRSPPNGTTHPASDRKEPTMDFGIVMFATDYAIAPD